MNLSWIKKVYLYLVSLISLVILVIAGIMLINLALKAWVFTKADNAYYGYAPVEECATSVGNLTSVPECNEKNAENYKQEEMERRAGQKQQDAAQALAMILVATPVFLYHWKLARKEA